MSYSSSLAGFKFYEKYYNRAQEIASRDKRRSFYEAILDYVFTLGEEPEIEDAEVFEAFDSIRHSLDTSIAGRINGRTAKNFRATPKELENIDALINELVKEKMEELQQP